jgi:hypothetical protein
VDIVILLALLALAFVVPLVLTIVVELAVGYAIGLRSSRGRWALVWANVMTNPPLVLLLMLALPFGGASYWALVAVLELAVVVVEWRLLAWVPGLRPRRAAWSSAVLNVSSFAAGVVVLSVRGGVF